MKKPKSKDLSGRFVETVESTVRQASGDRKSSRRMGSPARHRDDTQQAPRLYYVAMQVKRWDGFANMVWPDGRTSAIKRLDNSDSIGFLFVFDSLEKLRDEFGGDCEFFVARDAGPTGKEEIPLAGYLK